ncbi:MULTISPECIES: hypothetical protein [unclassified Thermococcus]|uniref:hypothetical protein n=1 Tax=unclassified Thermococcus TaxID=2627626 RepID=UPI00143B52EA|nr:MULTISPECIES: hypothetical protein [unclassified Thermococcus]
MKTSPFGAGRRSEDKAKVNFELNDKPTEILLDPNEWMININKKEKIEGIEVVVN